MYFSLLAMLALTAAASAYNPDSDPRWKVTGCYVSTERQLLFGYFAEESKCMSRSYCHDLCVKRSYKYFGLSSGLKCYCSGTLGDATAAPKDRCEWKCGGNSEENCGSDTTIIVLEITGKPAFINPKDVGSFGPSLGCYMVNTALRHSPLEAGCMTRSFCRQSCIMRSYMYFGLKLGTKCYCGNSLDEAEKLSKSKCMWKCGGNRRETCGSDVGMLVFLVTKSAHVSRSVPPTSSSDSAVPAIADKSTTEFEMLSLTKCSQSPNADGSPSTCSKAYDGNVNQNFNAGSCFQGKASSYQSRAWWRAKITSQARVKQVRIFNRVDCCREELGDLSIHVNWNTCAKYNSTVPISVKIFPCNAIGKNIKIVTSRPRLTLCEVQVFGSYVSP